VTSEFGLKKALLQNSGNKCAREKMTLMGLRIMVSIAKKVCKEIMVRFRRDWEANDNLNIKWRVFLQRRQLF
jgi:hypothetical protein